MAMRVTAMSETTDLKSNTRAEKSGNLGEVHS